MPPVIAGPRCNRRVTCSGPNNSRSESALAINPLNPLHMIASSKKFNNPMTYDFSIGAHASFDGGQSWIESPTLPLLAGWHGVSDPTMAWDDLGNAYLVGLPFALGANPNDATGTIQGICVHKSTDGGRTWGVPTLIHASNYDDKQWASFDGNPASPYFGNVYAAWDDGASLAFARTTDNGATWIGTQGQPAGTHIVASGSFAPEINVMRDGTVFIVWRQGTTIRFIKSTDGGDSFSAASDLATGVTNVPLQLPGGSFRCFTLPTACAGGGNVLVAAWADYSSGVSRIYYKRSTNGGNSWQGPAAGSPLLTGGLASAANQHEFHPQIIATPDGEIGCAFYEFGPKPGGGPSKIHVVLAVSTNGGNSFSERVNVTDTPWDPAVNAPWAHGDPNLTFIGEYFGFDASRLGFFPLWTDTRSGVQELFASRLSVNPADVYIRDSSSDTGTVPSPGNHWESYDLVVRRQQDGTMNFTNEDLLRDGVTDHYVYARVTNAGPNAARNVTVKVIVGNYPALNALPGTEFRYPQDWYEGDWDPMMAARHMVLGETAPININGNNPVIVGPILWPASQIPDPATWHPCLLAEVRADNNDVAGGPNGCDIDADPDACIAGSYFWGNNNVCQRNLSYAPLALAGEFMEFSFMAGSVYNEGREMEILVHKHPSLAKLPMRMRVDRIYYRDKEREPERHPEELVFPDGARVLIKNGDAKMRELSMGPGSVWRAETADGVHMVRDDVFGAVEQDGHYALLHPRASVRFRVTPGERRRITVTVPIPEDAKADGRRLLTIYQRNERKVITGMVGLDMEHPAKPKRPSTKKKKARRAATTQKRRAASRTPAPAKKRAARTKTRAAARSRS